MSSAANVHHLPVDDEFPTLLSSFALQYGSEFVWDCRSGQQMRVNALRLAFGHDTVKRWLAHPSRRMVRPDEVVFDPSCTSGQECINLFTGLPLQPIDNGEAADLFALLLHLCSEVGGEDEQFSAAGYVLDWLAYPLQNPGAKLPVALVFHGPQGTGKNLFFEAVARIYGRYAIVVGQDQLEDKFNDWASQKLFVIGDEVVARQELYHHKNKLKAFITGETIQINAKMLPLRTERNHMNVVFLSNESQPLALEDGDRRYFVVYCPRKDHGELYKRVVASLQNDGAAALYHHLLQRDLSRFEPYSPPPMTAAKRDLIELGLKPAERFVREWRDGLLPLPLRVCSSEQLYRAFKRWCAMEGERFPPPAVTFTKTVAKAASAWLQYEVVSLLSEQNGRKAQRCWVPVGTGPEAGVPKGIWAAESVTAFEDDLRRFLQAGGGSE